MAATTFKTILLDILRDLQAGDLVTATATGGSTSTVAVSGLAFSDASVYAHDGWYVYVATTTDGLAPQGELSRVQRGGFVPSTGTFQVSPNFTAAVGNGDTIYFMRERRSVYLDAVNRILPNLYGPAYTPLSMVTDGHLENSGVGSWTTIGTPSTALEKSTSNILQGTQSLHFVSDATDEGFASTAVPVHEGETLLVSVPVMCESGSARVILYDVTNSAEIEGVTVDQEDYAEVRFTDSAPDGCEEVAIRVVSKTAVSDVYVGWVMLLSQQRYVYDIPSLVEDAAHISRILSLPWGYPSEVANSYVIFARWFREWPFSDVMRDWHSAAAQRIEVGVPTWPLFLEYRKPYSTVSADTDTVTMPNYRILVEGALAELKTAQAQQNRENTVLHARLVDEARRHTNAYRRMLEADGLKRQVRRRVAAPVIVEQR